MFGILCGLYCFASLHCLAIVIPGLREKIRELWSENPGLAIFFVMAFVILVFLGSLVSNFLNKATGRKSTSFWDTRPPRD